MIRAEQIPLEVKLRLRNVLSDGETDEAVAIAAALNAWPGSYSLAENDSAEIRGVAAIILPLPQEVSDE